MAPGFLAAVFFLVGGFFLAALFIAFLGPLGFFFAAAAFFGGMLLLVLLLLLVLVVCHWSMERALEPH